MRRPSLRLVITSHCGFMGCSRLYLLPQSKGQLAPSGSLSSPSGPRRIHYPISRLCPPKLQPRPPSCSVYPTPKERFPLPKSSQPEKPRLFTISIRQIPLLSTAPELSCRSLYGSARSQVLVKRDWQYSMRRGISTSPAALTRERPSSSSSRVLRAMLSSRHSVLSIRLSTVYYFITIEYENGCYSNDEPVDDE